jgi:hypothetical protein
MKTGRYTVSRNIIFVSKRILEKQDGRVWTGFIWLKTGISGGFL